MRRYIWPKSFHYFENVQIFLVSLCVLLSLLVVAIFYFLYARTDELTVQRLKEQAQTYADLILHIKSWNYDYGGVYVEKQKGTESNAYLKQLGINPDITAAGGRTFTIRNHAIMVQEISRRSEKQDGVKFRIVSMRPLNPAYAPDPFEREAIGRFAQKGNELYRIEEDRGKPAIFRYVQPLHVERSCLECHSGKGYVLGSILGVLSISIPMEGVINESRDTKSYIVLAAIVTICIIIALTYFLTWRLVINLDEAQKRLKKLASTDELTGLKNRRTIMQRLDEEFQRANRQGTPLCLISLDIDHFKRINDSFGHPFGDLVLKATAGQMAASLRSYDQVGRIGGEEFIIVAPGTPLKEGVALAERVAKRIRSEHVTDGTREVTVTVSVGVTAVIEDDKDIEKLLRRADEALYCAKREGRDRVIALERDK